MRGHELVSDLYLAASSELNDSILVHIYAVRACNGYRASVPGSNPIQRLLIVMPNHLLEGAEPSLAGALIEGDDLVSAIIPAAFQTIIDELADLDEFDSVIASLLQRRFVGMDAHDDHMVVAQFVDVELLANPCAECRDQVADLLGREDLVLAGLLDIENLSSQRQDGLEATVARAFGRTTGGVTLHQVDLTQSGIAF